LKQAIVMSRNKNKPVYTAHLKLKPPVAYVQSLAGQLQGVGQLIPYPTSKPNAVGLGSYLNTLGERHG
jgi:hypothetical protein